MDFHDLQSKIIIGREIYTKLKDENAAWNTIFNKMIKALLHLWRKGAYIICLPIAFLIITEVNRHLPLSIMSQYNIIVLYRNEAKQKMILCLRAPFAK